MKATLSMFSVSLLLGCGAEPPSGQKTPPSLTAPAPGEAALGQPPAGPPTEGDFAPAFALKNQRGETVDLASYLGKKPIILYFYPKDDTPGCTTEAQEFRDRSDDFAAAGAVVLGVSLDPVESHLAFAEKFSLNFDLLADTEQTVTQRYGVLGDFGGTAVAKRVTFLIGKDGKVKRVFRDVDVSVHGEEVLQALKS